MNPSVSAPAPRSARAPVLDKPPDRFTATRLRDVPRSALLAALAWLCGALVLGASGLLRQSPAFIAVGFAIAFGGTLVAWRRSRALRAWTDGLDLRWPILLHVTRIGFGVLFLVELAAGHLPRSFAERGGYGDILAGALAIVAAFAAGRAGADQPTSPAGRVTVLAFSFVGLADILLVFATAQFGVLVDHDPLLLEAVGHLPYSLLPTVVVPLVILSHLLVLQRLRARAAAHPRSRADDPGRG